MSGVISVFTYKSVETILADGGSQSWALDRVRASRCDYLVCCRNANNPAVEGVEPHQSAFLVGKVKDVVPSDETEGRWKILISEFAHVDWPDQWSGRNPVAYWKDSDFSDENGKVYDFKSLEFLPVDKFAVTRETAKSRRLTIAEAKAGLAINFDVPESAIEIVVRG
jgi:hypothetical protein